MVSSASAVTRSAGNLVRSSHGGARLPAEGQAKPVVSQDAGGRAPITGSLGVPDCICHEPMPGEPVRGGSVQRGKFIRFGGLQLELQQIGEEVVVAEPVPLRVHRDDERARRLKVLQDPASAAAPGQQVGELAVDPVQHRRAQQQPPYRLGLAVEHLSQQVLGYGPFAAGEPGHESLRICVPGQRQRGQP